jgi:hypothetical protein
MKSYRGKGGIMTEIFNIPKEFKMVRYIFDLKFDITKKYDDDEMIAFREASPHFITTSYIMENGEETTPIIRSLN